MHERQVNEVTKNKRQNCWEGSVFVFFAVSLKLLVWDESLNVWKSFVFWSWNSCLFTTTLLCKGRLATMCATGELFLFGEKKKPPGLRKYDAVHECMIFFLSYYPLCILKVCLFHAWLTFILAMSCKGKWIMNPLGIIELIQHIHFSLTLSSWRFSTMFPLLWCIMKQIAFQLKQCMLQAV